MTVEQLKKILESMGITQVEIFKDMFITSIRVNPLVYWLDYRFGKKLEEMGGHERLAWNSDYEREVWFNGGIVVQYRSAI